MLKKKSLHKIYPDFHLFVEEDGYELSLGKILDAHLELSATRKKFFQRQMERCEDVESLENLILSEPICYDAYSRLADRYVKENRLLEVCNTLFLSLKFKKYPVIAKNLLAIIKKIEGKDSKIL